MAIHLSAPRATELKPRIVVFGVGGAGGNAVNNMIEAGLEGVEFVVANTDAQQLQFAKTDRRVQLGVSLTQGLGAGAHPEVGMTAAEESAHEIAEHLEGAHMVFITAGMGGGTGTGAAPIIAKTARERGILTVGVVTKPFMFEGRHRMRLADAGIAELQRYVDTLIVIPNQNLFRIANERTTFAEAFGMADQVLHSGVRSITDLMVLPGLINLDFADVRSVMSEMGKAMMGTGEASGDDRALQAAQNAIANPLLDETSLKGAKAVLVNVTGGLDMTLLEVDEAANAISSEVDPDANIIFGAAFDPTLEGKLRVSVVATGMDSAAAQQQPPVQQSVSQNPRQSVYITPGRPGAAQPVQQPVQAAAPAPQPAPQPQPVQQAAPAPQPELRPEPTISAARPNLFDERPAAPAPQPQYQPQPEARVIAKIIDPSVEDEFDIPAAPVQAPAPAQSREIPQRPVGGYGTVRPQDPVRAPQSQQRPLAEDDNRGGLWRGLFPNRQRNETPAPDYRQPAPQPQSYAPAPQAQPAPQPRVEPQQTAEVEDDLEIPSFLRRLAN
ncbi:cell division protein FtsZ [Asticcacaulis sp. YBE204]|uniref:cell division protein FtsZ n=1 Tax=Asticcacaulis sp. YBE204 TaxID=1282363 RepID=UPI0003C40731|nr:cell division protein FtsZ [Asticcacaulis sp. YBE204]ESQ80179.1 cell division protein FtsZ [Asticcacaulis sp. YBE204]